MESPGAESSPPDRRLINVRLIITDINIEYKKIDLQSLSCLSDEDIWSLGGDDKIMIICNARGGGELVKSIKTKSENNPWNIQCSYERELGSSVYW